MAGHSKWANIQYRKGAQDKKRGKLFTKLIREITVAARSGGDPAGNPRLRLAIDRALDANMTKDTVERAVKRGTGELGGEQIEEIRYEGYGPGGVAIMVDCMTDNRTRTVGEVRQAFSKHGGNLGADGSVGYLFKKRGQLLFKTGDAAAEERILEVALEAGADDVVSEGGYTEVLCAPESFEALRKALEAAGLKPEHADVAMRPSTTVKLEGEAAQQLLKLLDALEDLDDVQSVVSNADLPDELLHAA
ncbi:MAG: YebC/PmpR family DNA-binding transcriptional regulator [Gammaproteobacteria bacterium]|nr:YebC/PmpR family DNA-binding transcriptional regulator [Gammaproteobacteria bacterium]